MRTILATLAVIGLVACDSGQVPSPADRMAGEVPVQTVDEGLVALHDQGLVAGPESFFFAAGRNEVEAALTNVLGDPVSSNAMAECGAGPMEMTSFPGELTVNFQDGSLVGWNLGTAPDDEAAKIQVDADAAIGMPLEELKSAPTYAPIKGSTLGEEFALSNTMGGFVEGEAVDLLYAGTQCFFR